MPRLPAAIALLALLALPACVGGAPPETDSMAYELQSPIDVAGYERADGPAPEFAYGGGEPSIEVANGFITAVYAPGNVLSLGGREYTLQSMHAHAASEHRIDGELFAAELHMVHHDEDGGLLVVGVLYELGAPNPVVQGLLDAGAGGSGGGPVSGLDAALLPPGASGHYRYRGSKTTPPFNGPVEWLVMRQRQTVSQEQADAIRAVNGGEPNNREIQPRDGRELLLIASGCSCAVCSTLA